MRAPREFGLPTTDEPRTDPTVPRAVYWSRWIVARVIDVLVRIVLVSLPPRRHAPSAHWLRSGSVPGCNSHVAIMRGESCVRRVVGVLVAVGLAASAVTSAGGASAATSTSPYVVVIREGADPGAIARSVGSTPTFVYRTAINGFAANLTSAQKNQLAKSSPVLSVTADDVIGLNEPALPTPVPPQPAQVVPPGIRRIGALASPTAAIDGVDTRVNLDVAVMDTGIDIDHPDLNVVGGVDCGAGKGYDDGNGHGTHVAGTLGAIDNDIGVVGVAPGVRLWAVRVFNKSALSSTSKIICGIDWITAHSDVIHLVNYSGGGRGFDDGSCGTTVNGAGNSGPLHAAFCDSVEHGVTYVVSAMNSSTDAANYAPASFDEVITVSAYADWDGLPGGLGAQQPCWVKSNFAFPDDVFAFFSNYGADVDLTAPGVCVLSTWPGGGYAYDIGTSMAAPHATGAAALYLANHPGVTSAQVRQALIDNSDPAGVAGDPDATREPVLSAAGL